MVERDSAGGYSAWSPDLPGCAAAAAAYDECIRLMREAIEFHLDGLREEGEPVPEPHAVAALVVPAA